MKILATLLIASCLSAILPNPAAKKIRIFLAGDSTMSIKDRRAFPETGWGMPFVHMWDSSVIVVNLAKNGRSTKSFRAEGLWQQILDAAQPGDHVIIQFGHNDESKDKGDRYSPPDSFKMNLSRFISEARSKQAVPVLVTPVSRRKFDASGQALPTHAAYSPLVVEVARRENVLLIDLDEKSRALYQRFGPENSKWLFLQLQPGEHPNHPEGKNDNTHFSELGARLIAQIMWRSLTDSLPELAARTSQAALRK
jgi:lysophospholipase L1-like esterase